MGRRWAKHSESRAVSVLRFCPLSYHCGCRSFFGLERVFFTFYSSILPVPKVYDIKQRGRVIRFSFLGFHGAGKWFLYSQRDVFYSRIRETRRRLTASPLKLFRLPSMRIEWIKDFGKNEIVRMKFRNHTVSSCRFFSICVFLFPFDFSPFVSFFILLLTFFYLLSRYAPLSPLNESRKLANS